MFRFPSFRKRHKKVVAHDDLKQLITLTFLQSLKIMNTLDHVLAALADQAAVVEAIRVLVDELKAGQVDQAKVDAALAQALANTAALQEKLPVVEPTPEA